MTTVCARTLLMFRGVRKYGDKALADVIITMRINRGPSRNRLRSKDSDRR